MLTNFKNYQNLIPNLVKLMVGTKLKHMMVMVKQVMEACFGFPVDHSGLAINIQIACNLLTVVAKRSLMSIDDFLAFLLYFVSMTARLIETLKFHHH